MAASLGSLLVRLGLDSSEFTSGMSKAEMQAQRFGQRLERSITAGVLKAQIAMEVLVQAARLAGEAFQVLTTGAADFKDLEETTGASAESIASLAVAAATAGVEIGSVAGSMNKLTRGLVGVNDESKAAGAALKAIGIDVKAFKQLDPAAQYEAVGKALSGYADGAGKVAIAQALFGKQGAEQLKVFAALEEAGGRQTILTQAQIELADAYADRRPSCASTPRPQRPPRCRRSRRSPTPAPSWSRACSASTRRRARSPRTTPLPSSRATPRSPSRRCSNRCSPS
jgi:hypothetical protein